MSPRPRPGAVRIAGRMVEAGATAEIQLRISEHYTAQPVSMPVAVIRGEGPGPSFFLTAAVHGAELDGVEIVRRVVLGVGPPTRSEER